MPRSEAAEERSHRTFSEQPDFTCQSLKLYLPRPAECRVEAINIRSPGKLMYLVARHFGRHTGVERGHNRRAPLRLAHGPTPHRAEQKAIQLALEAPPRIDHRGVHFEEHRDATAVS